MSNGDEDPGATWGALNNLDPQFFTGENALRNPIDVLMSALKEKELNNGTLSINEGKGHWLGTVVHVKDNHKRSTTGIDGLQEALKDKSFLTYELKVYVPEMQTNACPPGNLPSDTENWNEEDWGKVGALPTFIGTRPIGTPGYDEPKPGDIVAVEYTNKNKPSKGGTYVGIAYDQRRKWDDVSTKKGAAKKAFAKAKESAEATAIYKKSKSGGSTKIKTICIDVTEKGKKEKEEICYADYGLKQCYHELDQHSSPDYKIASSDPLREQKGAIQGAPWLVTPFASANPIQKAGLGPLPSKKKTISRLYVDPMPLSTRPNMMAYQALCLKNFFPNDQPLPEYLATFYHDYDSGKNLAKKDIMKKIKLPSSYNNWVQEPARNFNGTRVNKKLELLFLMVFNQIHLLREQGHPDLQKFQIYSCQCYKNVRPIATKYTNPKTNKKEQRYVFVEKKNYRKGIIDKANKDSAGNNKILPYPEKISTHSFGITLDINEHRGTTDSPTWDNPMLPKNGWTSVQDWRNARDAEAKAGGPRFKIPKIVIQVFKAYGFRWGGNYADDIMHFEFVGDSTHILASYINGIIFAIKSDGEGGWSKEATSSTPVKKYPAKSLIIGTPNSYWNKKLLKHLKKLEIPAPEGLSGGKKKKKK